MAWPLTKGKAHLDHTLYLVEATAKLLDIEQSRVHRCKYAYKQGRNSW